MVVEGLKEEIAHALLPILHFSFDTWTCKVSGRKFLGIHVFWVDRKFSLRDAVLAVGLIARILNRSVGSEADPPTPILFLSLARVH